MFGKKRVNKNAIHGKKYKINLIQVLVFSDKFEPSITGLSFSNVQKVRVTQLKTTIISIKDINVKLGSLSANVNIAKTDKKTAAM